MTMAAAAIQYLEERSWLSIALILNDKKPPTNGWQNLRLDTPEKIKAHFNGKPQNIGILTGEPSNGLIDVDLDFPEAKHLAETFLPETVTFGRKSKPRSHWEYQVEPIPATTKFQFCPPGSQNKQMVVEVRSTGCQTMVPPSVHPSEERITWDSNREVTRITPKELIDRVGIVAAGALMARHWPKQAGIRDELAMALSGGLLRAGWNVEEAGKFILAVCRAAGDEEAKQRVEKPRHTQQRLKRGDEITGWPRLAELLGKDVVGTVRKWLSAESETQPVADASYNLTDLGNAGRLVEQRGENLRYVYPWGRWIHWTGTHWQKDETGEVIRLAKETVKIIYAEASKAGTKDDRKEISHHAVRSESEGKIRAMISLAQSESEVSVRPDVLDANPMLLNCLNGTVDLTTGQLKPHTRSDFVTRVIQVEYDPEALCPRWERFLSEVFPKKSDLNDFFQRAVGYSLTGLTTEQVVFILWGAGANGKSTTVELLRCLFGDYARQIPADSLMIRKVDSGQSNDIAALKGSRLVTASECEEGQRLAESRLKALTGGDTITARHLYSEFFEFRPEFKLWIATNHRPEIRGTDLAIWRRIRLIPFTVTISPLKQDKRLADKLKEELPGGPGVGRSWVLRVAARRSRRG